MVQWAPPAPDSKILVRGYILGYGRGIADVYQVRLDANTHDYTIKNLRKCCKSFFGGVFFREEEGGDGGHF